MFSVGELLAQDYELETGKTRSGKTELVQSILLDDGRVVSLKAKGSMMASMGARKLQLELLDEGLNPIKSVETDIKYFNVWSSTPDNQFQFADLLDGRVYVFYSKQDSKTDFRLYARELDFESMKLSKDDIEIAKFSKKGKKDLGSVDYVLSRDGENLLVYFQEYVKIDGRRNTYTEFVVMDKNLDVIWNEKYLDDKGEGYREYLSYEVNNKGEVFILKKIYDSNKRVVLGNRVNYTFSIMKFDAKGEFIVEKDLDLPDYHVKDVVIAHNDQDELICAGFYSDRNGNSADGTYFARYTSDRLTKKKVKIDAFSVDFMTDGKRKSAERKAVRKDNRGARVELPNLAVRDVVLRSDGGILLIGEEYYVREQSDGDMEYWYNDIMVININKEGSLDWAKKIYKRQELYISGGTGVLAMTVSAVNLAREGFLSYTQCVVGDKIYFVYNDHKNNFDGRAGRDYSITPDNIKSVCAITSIDVRGNIEKEILFENEDNKVVVYPRDCVQLNSSKPQLLLFGRWKSTERYMRLNF
jgi:hypothetical protein